MNQPAWNARIGLLLSADDSRRGRPTEAAARLGEASAVPIGLEAYRLLRRAQALEAAQRLEEALESARRAVEEPGPFAFRTRAAELHARLLERRGRVREALEALARAAESAVANDDIAILSIARIRLGLAARDAGTVRAASRDLILKAPTADAARTTPDFARRAAAAAEKSLAPAERGRRGRALVAAGDARRGVPLLTEDRPAAWPPDERARNLLALARGLLALKKEKAAESAAALVPDDGTPAVFEARLLRCDLVAGRLRSKKGAGSTGDAAMESVRRALEGLTAPDVPDSVRRAARERLLRDAAERDRFDDALGHARELAREESGSGIGGFEPLWLLCWREYLAGDFAGARERFEALSTLYTDVPRSRRLAYWRARCLAVEGHTEEARRVFEDLAMATPPDLYARFAQAHAKASGKRREQPPLKDPSTETAAFRRVDELLRLRMFEEAAAEARGLPPSRGRDLRMAEADFALGRFVSAAGEIKRALPQIGTAEEGRVPEEWRRLYYPLEEGNILAAQARESGVDAWVLRGLVRQESGFDAHARSRAGALGLTQLMPATARGLARSVLRARYRRAFLYDPGVNARLGAAYLKRLIDGFHGSTILGLAAYNGGPSRVARVMRDNPRLAEDELFETIPVFETRDYVRRVILYAASYKELYP